MYSYPSFSEIDISLYSIELSYICICVLLSHHGFSHIIKEIRVGWHVKRREIREEGTIMVGPAVS